MVWGIFYTVHILSYNSLYEIGKCENTRTRHYQETGILYPRRARWELEGEGDGEGMGFGDRDWDRDRDRG